MRKPIWFLILSDVKAHLNFKRLSWPQFIHHMQPRKYPGYSFGLSEDIALNNLKLKRIWTNSKIKIYQRPSPYLMWTMLCQYTCLAQRNAEVIPQARPRGVRYHISAHTLSHLEPTIPPIRWAINLGPAMSPSTRTSITNPEIVLSNTHERRRNNSAAQAKGVR